MRITDVYVGYLKITRIIQIGSILVKHGFKEMISHTFLGRRIRKRRIRQHKPVYTTQERLRLTIEDLRGVYRIVHKKLERECERKACKYKEFERFSGG